jgi:hypothetical protein
MWIQHTKQFRTTGAVFIICLEQDAKQIRYQRLLILFIQLLSSFRDEEEINKIPICAQDIYKQECKPGTGTEYFSSRTHPCSLAPQWAFWQDAHRRRFAVCCTRKANSHEFHSVSSHLRENCCRTGQ